MAIDEPTESTRAESEDPEAASGVEVPIKAEIKPARTRKRRVPIKKPALAAFDVKALAARLEAVHALMAVAIPEMVIDKNESVLLADAITDVLSQYKISVDPVLVAWVNMFTTVAIIYGPRYLLIRARMNAVRKERTVATPSASPAESVTISSTPIRYE
ncbi:MAG: hypothetical protein ACREBU_00530 [Nitrososphaera sp.]